MVTLVKVQRKWLVVGANGEVKWKVSEAGAFNIARLELEAEARREAIRNAFSDIKGGAR